MRISSPPNKIVKNLEICSARKIQLFRIIPVYWMYIFPVRSFIHYYQAYTNCVRSLFSVLISLLRTMFTHAVFSRCVFGLHMPFLVDVYSVYFARAAKINPTSKCPIDNDPIFKIQKLSRRSYSESIAILFFRIHFIFHSGRPVCILVWRSQVRIP